MFHAYIIYVTGYFLISNNKIIYIGISIYTYKYKKVSDQPVTYKKI
ncbi:hypothetical protein COSHB9_03020 [Companilactobacillus alimentarius]